MNIYVASSWRNVWQPAVVRLLRGAGHHVYDFKHPHEGDTGFHWSAVDHGWQEWDHERYRRALNHPIAAQGFKNDMDALRACDACVLVQPCGTSAHLELGWAIGAGKRSAGLFPTQVVPMAEDCGGHTLCAMACGPCGDLDGCHLPAKLRKIEPELMAKMADVILIGKRELLEWAK